MAGLFSDDFESGDMSAWTGNLNDEGDLSVTEGAALHGTYGLSCFIDDTNNIYVYKEIADKSRVRMRFYVDTNGITMGADEWFVLSNCVNDGASKISFQVVLGYTGSVYQIWMYVHTDTGETWSSGHTITDGVHCIETDWKKSGGVGQDNGFFSLWIDGEFKETLADIDNDTMETKYLSLGSFDFVGTEIGGTIYLDDFVSNDDGSEIGLLEIIKELAEAFSVADSLVNSAVEQLAEAFSVVDSLANSADKVLSEAFGIVDSMANSASEALAEAFSVVDTKVTDGAKALAEAFSVVDSLANSGKKLFAETLSVVMYNWRKLRCAVLVWTPKDAPVTAWVAKDMPITAWAESADPITVWVKKDDPTTEWVRRD